MTIDEAIEIMELDKTCDFEGNAEALEAALQLGIEALKRCQILAKNDTYWAKRPLEGEK